MKKTLPISRKQQGFTLLELLVVVSVLAAMAGIAAVAMDGYEQEAQEQLVHVEMKRIANAIYRFKEDTGYFPKEGVYTADSLSLAGQDKTVYDTAENLTWLFANPKSDLSWNPNVGRGWHGPYITTESQQRYKVGDCDLVPNFVTSLNVSESFVALADTFERTKAYTNTDDDCFIVRDKGNWIPRAFSGMPYQYDLAYTNSEIPDCSTSCVAIISAGKNSEIGESTNNDDIINVLRAN